MADIKVKWSSDYQPTQVLDILTEKKDTQKINVERSDTGAPVVLDESRGVVIEKIPVPAPPPPHKEVQIIEPLVGREMTKLSDDIDQALFHQKVEVKKNQPKGILAKSIFFDVSNIEPDNENTLKWIALGSGLFIGLGKFT